MRGWRNIVLAVILAAVAFSLNRYAEPAIYRVFPPSPTITTSPTITQTPTITLTPTISLTPTITTTPMFSPTPMLPTQYLEKFTAQVTPSTDAVFSSLQFAARSKEIYRLNHLSNLPTRWIISMEHSVMTKWLTVHNGQPSGYGVQRSFVMKQNPGMVEPAVMDILIVCCPEISGCRVSMKCRYTWGCNI